MIILYLLYSFLIKLLDMYQYVYEKVDLQFEIRLTIRKQNVLNISKKRQH